MGITKGEYLAELRAQAEDAARTRRRSAKRGAAAGAGLVLATALVLAVGSLATFAVRGVHYRELVSGQGAAAFETLGYRDAFAVWNSRDLGNDVNTLLGGGKVYCRGAVSVLPAEGGYAVRLEGELAATIPGSISYINAAGMLLYYRDDVTRDICVCDMRSGQIGVLVQGNAGEVFLCDERLYFIDYDAGSCLVSTSLTGSDKRIAVDEPVSSFAVCGESVLYLGTDRTLSLKSGPEEAAVRLISPVERFFLDGDIVVQSGGSVFRFTAARGAAALLHRSAAEDMQLAGACADGIFYQEGGSLFFADGGGETAVFAQGAGLYRSVSVDEEGTVRCIALSAIDDTRLLEAAVPALGGEKS